MGGQKNCKRKLCCSHEQCPHGYRLSLASNAGVLQYTLSENGLEHTEQLASVHTKSRTAKRDTVLLRNDQGVPLDLRAEVKSLLQNGIEPVRIRNTLFANAKEKFRVSRASVEPPECVRFRGEEGRRLLKAIQNYAGNFRRAGKSDMKLENAAELKAWCAKHSAEPEDNFVEWLEKEDPDSLIIPPGGEFVSTDEGEQGGFMFFSKRVFENVKRWSQNNPEEARIIECDGTFKLHHDGWVLFLVGTHESVEDYGEDNLGRHSFRVFCYAFVKTENEGVLRKVFGALKTAALEIHGVDFEPTLCVADASEAIRNAVEHVWPSISYLTCYPHIVMKVEKNEGNKIRNNSNIEIILDHLGSLHLCETDESFLQLSELCFKYWTEVLDEREFAVYFLAQYMTGRWKCWYIGAAPIYGVVPMQNPIESNNRSIKRSKVWQPKQSTFNLLHYGLKNLLLFDGENLTGSCRHLLTRVPHWCIVSAHEYLKKKGVAGAFKLNKTVLKAYSLNGLLAAYVLPSSRGDGVLSPQTVESYLKLRVKGEHSAPHPITAAALDKALMIGTGYHLVTVSENPEEDLPVMCGCKGFQKSAHCSHSVFVAHLEGLSKVDLVKDFDALPENKKRGRKPKKDRQWGHCLQRK